MQDLLAEDEDVVNDLIGYLVLLKIGMNDEKNKEILIWEEKFLKKDFKSVTIPLHQKTNTTGG